MKKISITFLFFLIIPLLISCSEEDLEDETFTLELIGESTVYIEEGMPYVDQGILLNGEPTFDVSYMSNVDTKRVGTYYVEFMYADQTLLRTVVVTEGANTIYKRMIDALKTADSYSYTQQLEVSYKNNGTEVNYYYNKGVRLVLYLNYTYSLI